MMRKVARVMKSQPKCVSKPIASTLPRIASSRSGAIGRSQRAACTVLGSVGAARLDPALRRRELVVPYLPVGLV